MRPRPSGEKLLRHALQYDANNIDLRSALILLMFPTETVQSIMGAMEKRRSSEFRAFSLFFNAFTRFFALRGLRF
jgi:hypothetical protein